MSITIALITSLPATVAVAASAYMAVQGVEGWGWFLFGGLLLAWSIKVAAS